MVRSLIAFFLAGLLQVGAATSHAQNIQVLEATYGGNCATATRAVARGNASAAVARTCNGLASCRFPVSPQGIGDPAPGCRKDFRVSYRCGTQAAKTAYMEPTAGSIGEVQLICSGGAGAGGARPPGPGPSGPGPTPQDQARCRNYATTAVRQQAENLRLKCGLTGPRWQSNTGNHFNACSLSVPAYAQYEERERASALVACANRVPPRYRARWDKIAGPGPGWTTGWAIQTEPYCGFMPPHCGACPGVNSRCGKYTNGVVINNAPRGIHGECKVVWKMRCTVQKLP